MNLQELVSRTPRPEPWAEGEKIPWHEPEFSERMLAEHLTQKHDAASRRLAKIESQVGWIHAELLGGRETSVLDLGCGPGLYANRLSRLGHRVAGIDFSPASIRYAKETAAGAVEFQLGDIREAEYGDGYGLVMLLFGEFNTFRPVEAESILRNAYGALADGGTLLLEPHTEAGVIEIGRREAVWRSQDEGLFSQRPHLYLTENYWDEGARVATTRFIVIDAESAEVERHAQSLQAYSDREYRELLEGAGFSGVEFFPSLTGVEDESQQRLMAVTARK